MMKDSFASKMLTLGGADFTSQAKMEEIWSQPPELSRNRGSSEFVADLIDHEGAVIDDKVVEAEVVSMCLREPIESIICDARKAPELEELN
ncbi:hypothetical protein [Vibrio crassostreae]|uniref:hypothetical protein n=1 Tax=Vibrio crassostreae TaxID=246167 RepID=UPI001B30C798|nr:hypothetical protein [Vibrio crassostreae]